MDTPSPSPIINAVSVFRYLPIFRTPQCPLLRAETGSPLTFSSTVTRQKVLRWSAFTSFHRIGHRDHQEANAGIGLTFHFVQIHEYVSAPYMLHPLKLNL